VNFEEIIGKARYCAHSSASGYRGANGFNSVDLWRDGNGKELVVGPSTIEFAPIKLVRGN